MKLKPVLVIFFFLVSIALYAFTEALYAIDLPDDEFPLLYSTYVKVLDDYVNDRGMVNYQALQNHSKNLDLFIFALEKVEPVEYEYWSKDEKLAFWINTYNALTLKSIINNYPVTSIKNIPGVWSKKNFTVMGTPISLDEIEHKILRKEFDEPRIHMALSCASISSPSLRNEPYIAETLNYQLTDQTHKFLLDPNKFQIDLYHSKIYISPIFKWYGEDFISKYGNKVKFKGLKKKERAVMSFIDKYSDKKLKDFLYANWFYLGYLGYNWNLNDGR